MADSERPGSGVNTDVLADIEAVLSRHPVRLALVFGSVARGVANEGSDVDVAVEFERLHPGDAGYSEAYLGLLSELDSTLSNDVDLVDVRTMKPRFARVVFDTGVLVLGTEERRNELEGELAGELLSVRDARDRVSAAVARLE